MSKIGRNEPCPCGSGRKFKKCHGGETGQSNHSSIPRSSYEAGFTGPWLPSEAHERYARKFREMHEERLVLFASRESRTLETLERHEKWISTQIAKILKDHSPLFWLCLQRAERLTETMVTPDHRAYLSFVKLCLETMFWKYGDRTVNDMKVAPSGKITGKIEAEHVSLYAGELAALACERINLPTVYQRVAKGASLEVGRDGHFVADLPPHLCAAGLKYERRRNSVGSYQLEEKGLSVPTLSFLGSWAAAFAYEDLGITASKWPLLYYKENTEPDGAIEYSTGGFGGFEDPRFMRASLDLGEWEDRLECFSEAMSLQTGMTISELKAGFLSLNDLLLSHIDGDGGVSCHVLGLLPIPRAVLIEELSAALLRHLPSYSISNVERLRTKLIAFLEPNSDALEHFDLFSPVVPCVLTPLDGDIILLDVSQIYRKLLDTMQNLQFDAKMRTSKGTTFEAIIGAEIRRHCEGITFPIPDSHHLFKFGATAPFAEADLYIAKGNLLFVVDCKAYCIDNRYLKGEPQVVRNRWRRVRAWLSESDTRARLIAQYPVGANYRIPSVCKYIIPVVCSSMAEYIWEDEAMTQLTESIPRVCTIQELIELIEESPGLGLERRPYAIQVAHNHA